MPDKVSYKERKLALEAATEVFLEGESKSDEPPLNPNKFPETYTEKALRKLMRKGKVVVPPTQLE